MWTHKFRQPKCSCSYSLNALLIFYDSQYIKVYGNTLNSYGSTGNGTVLYRMVLIIASPISTQQRACAR